MDGQRDERPDPELLLKQNFPRESDKGRGRLKIFFGYAAGVGKTYAMLEAARQEKAAGRDVVAGYIEPHDRPDTMELLAGMELLTPMAVTYKGIILKEFDLDAALMRRPDLILVDELAHTNAQGCRHKKRYQDVIELLDAGINVYTTVNVQHLESLHDIVASITHVRVYERIPDDIFDDAGQVELVDIAPEELRQRLEDGKIYHKDQADKASVRFFTVENLSALREIALRRTADRVNREVVRERDAAGKDYYTGEHVLVCLSPSPTNARVITHSINPIGNTIREIPSLTAAFLAHPAGDRDWKQCPRPSPQAPDAEDGTGQQEPDHTDQGFQHGPYPQGGDLVQFEQVPHEPESRVVDVGQHHGSRGHGNDHRGQLDIVVPGVGDTGRDESGRRREGHRGRPLDDAQRRRDDEPRQDEGEPQARQRGGQSIPDAAGLEDAA